MSDLEAYSLILLLIALCYGLISLISFRRNKGKIPPSCYMTGATLNKANQAENDCYNCRFKHLCDKTSI